VSIFVFMYVFVLFNVRVCVFVLFTVRFCVVYCAYLLFTVRFCVVYCAYLCLLCVLVYLLHILAARFSLKHLPKLAFVDGFQ
jgi:hypothetical protein